MIKLLWRTTKNYNQGIYKGIFPTLLKTRFSFSQNQEKPPNQILQPLTLIEKIVPEKYHPYVHLGRYEQPIGYMLLFWPCAWGVVLGYPNLVSLQDTLNVAYYCSVFLFGSATMRAAGCIINDIWDKDFDQKDCFPQRNTIYKVKRTENRPITSGQITVQQSIPLLVGNLAGGLLVLTQINMLSIKLSFGILPIVVIYPAFKRFFKYPQLILGLAFNWGIVVGYTTLSGFFDPYIVIPSYLGGIAWTLIYDTIYAHQDKEDDQQIGIYSTALTWGQDTKQVIQIMNYVTFICFSTTGYFSGFSVAYYAQLLLGNYLLHQQIQKLNLDDRDQCRKFFEFNNIFGFLVFISMFMANQYKARQLLPQQPTTEKQAKGN